MISELQYTIEDIKTIADGKLLSLSGEIDETNQKDLEDLIRQTMSNCRHLVINIKRLNYINSGVIGMLAMLHEELAGEGKEFVFAEANEHIFDIIELVGLTSVINLYQTNEEAFVSFED